MSRSIKFSVKVGWGASLVFYGNLIAGLHVRERQIRARPERFKVHIVVLSPVLAILVHAIPPTNQPFPFCRQPNCLLQVRLVADDAPEQTVHVGQLGPGGFFLLPPLARDGRSYCLQLEGGTGGAGTTGTSCFRANSSHRHLSLSYAPEAPQHADHDVVARSSLLALPVTVALLVACYHSSRILGLVSDLVGVLRGLAKGSENPTGSPLDSRRKAKARRT